MVSGAGRGSTRASMGWNMGPGPKELQVLLPLPGSAEAGAKGHQGRTFSEAVLWVLDILAEVGDLLQEVSGVGHVCCAPLGETVLVCLWAGVWGGVGKGVSEGCVPASSSASGGACSSWRAGARTISHCTPGESEPKTNENLPQRSPGASQG